MIPEDLKHENNQDQQFTGLLRTLLLVAAVASFLSALIFPVISSQPILAGGAATALAVIYFGLILFLRKERARTVGFVFLFVSWLALGLSAAFISSGLSSPFLDAYVLVVATAGLLLGSEIGYAYATLSLLTVVGYYLLGRAGLMRDPWGSPSAEFVTSMRLIHLLLAYVLIYLTTKSIKTEVARTQAHKNSLQEKNRELQAIQETLEQHVLERSAEILKQSQYFRALVDNIPVSVVTLDQNNRIITCNPAFEALFQYTLNEVVGKQLDRLITDERTQAEAENCTRKVIQGEIVQYKSIRYRRDGSAVDVEIFGVPVVVSDQQLGVLVLYSDITEQKRAEGFLQHIASHDSLTGLPNRMLFSDRLNHAIQKASRSGGKLAVAFLDLDNFKTVNDTYGHGKGDLILKEVAERLKCGVRASDTIARLGGDEFTFIFEAIGDARDVLSISQKIVDTLVDPFELDGNQVVITASVGVSLFPDDGDNSVILIRKADEAMYASKLLGQNRCQLYSRESVDQPEIFKKQPTLSKK